MKVYTRWNKHYFLAFLALLCTNLSLSQTIEASSNKTDSTVEQLQYPNMNVLMNYLLFRCRHNYSQAQKEVEQILNDPRRERDDKYQGWAIVNQENTEIIRIDFASATGPPLSATKRVFREKTFATEIQCLGYDIRYDMEGRVKFFSTRPPVETLGFYDDGKIREFSVQLSESRFFGAAWNQDGKLIREGIRTQ